MPWAMGYMGQVQQGLLLEQTFMLEPQEWGSVSLARRWGEC